MVYDYLKAMAARVKLIHITSQNKHINVFIACVSSAIQKECCIFINEGNIQFSLTNVKSEQ